MLKRKKLKQEETNLTSHEEFVATTLKANNIKSPLLWLCLSIISTKDDTHNEILTYTLLNTQSDTTLILDEVAVDLSNFK